MSDLRAFLERLRAERKSDLLVVEKEVSPRHETAAILAKLEERQRSPVLYFERVTGSRFPLVSNVAGSMGRLAFALDCPLKAVAERYREGATRPVEPVLVEPAPVQEHVYQGQDIDLSMLPAMVYHAGDAAEPYLTAAIAVAKDPETGKSNLSFHRMMIAGRDRTGIFIEKGKHLDAIYKKWEARGLPMPLAVFLGSHPLWMLGALYSGRLGVEEYSIIGGLLRAPLELARGLTQPSLEVPARAEFVLEGFVPPHTRLREGPFGEFTGYGTGTTESPVFQLTALTHRTGAIFQDVVSGHVEHLILPMPAIEHRTLEDARALCPGVRRVALVAPLTAVVALDKQDDAEPRRLLEGLLRADIYAKHVIVVDADVEPSDLRQVLQAMALCTQARRDVLILDDELGTPLDPSAESESGRVSKMGIDATRRKAPRRSLTANTLPAEVLARVDLDSLLKRPG